MSTHDRTPGDDGTYEACLAYLNAKGHLLWGDYSLNPNRNDDVCPRCNGRGREMNAEVQIGAPSCLACFGTGKKENPMTASNECSEPNPDGGAPCCRPLGHHVLTDHWNGQDEWPAQPVPSSGTPGDERPDAGEDTTWSCKIGPASRGDLPSGSDAPMRAAVEAAFRKLTGHDPEWTFSGWAYVLTEAERAVVEGRLPRPRVIAAAAREQMERAEAVIGTDLDPEVPERGWEIHEPDDALRIVADQPAPSTPVPEASERPDTEALRYMAKVTAGRVNNRVDWAKALNEAADWIDARPAPSSPPVGDRGLDVEQARPGTVPGSAADLNGHLASLIADGDLRVRVVLAVDAWLERCDARAAADREEPTDG